LKLSPLRKAPEADPSDAPAPRPPDETLHGRVYQELRNGIREGRFATGQSLTTHGPAAMFGASPMPAREAVRRLVRENSLEILPNRTMRTRPLSRTRFEEFADVRAATGGHAAARAARRMNAAAFAEIKSAGALANVGDLDRPDAHARTQPYALRRKAR